MPDLTDRLRPTQFSKIAPEPVIYRLANEFDQERVSDLITSNPDANIIDTYEDQLQELFILDNPALYADRDKLAKEFPIYMDAYFEKKPKWEFGVWVYLPWRQTLLHLLESVDFRRVRTARNRNLITEEEQRVYYNSTIGVAGLSVGNSCALALVLTGGGRRLRLADPEELKLTNLNRIRGSVADLTAPKVHLTARQIYELDPYAELELFTDGLTEENIEQFFDGPPKLDVVIDEIDNVDMKVRIREEAKKRQIPVVMAADNGDGGILDVERHDLNDDIEPFHGRAGKQLGGWIGRKAPLPTIGNILTEDMLGVDAIDPRMKESLLEIGKTLPVWPQIGTASLLNGMATAMVVRKILTKQPVIDDRAFLSIESWIVPGYDSEEAVAKRKEESEGFAKKFRKSMK